MVAQPVQPVQPVHLLLPIVEKKAADPSREVHSEAVREARRLEEDHDFEQVRLV